MYCFYGGDGDTPENDSDPTDYVWDDEPGDCGGQWIDNPSTTVIVDADPPPDPEPGDDDNDDDDSTIAEIPLSGMQLRPTGCASEPLHIPLHVVSPYGWRTLNGKPDFHTGVDYRAPVGTPVFSAESGTVALAYSSASAGNVIVVQNPFGGDSIYMHLSGFGVSKGQSVGAGTQIGKSGNTGHSTGPHLHFEQHKPGPIYANGVFNHATLTPPC
jgi:murein DD-endopeptidase MepM/ murein hydrolase activator NlpD